MKTARKPRKQTSLAEFRQTLFDILPDQGSWSEERYLWLSEHTNRLIEYTDGYLEFLPMPTDKHQSIMEFLFVAFRALVLPMGGKVHVAGLRLQIRPGKYREPDIVLLKAEKDPRWGERFWTGADLALEVVSQDKPERDLIQKRGDYAEGRIPEYWIVNPQTDTITVLRLKGKSYVRHGLFRRGSRATSVILPGFSVDVAAVFDAK
jgi:Uma2 family endonuclease